MFIKPDELMAEMNEEHDYLLNTRKTLVCFSTRSGARTAEQRAPQNRLMHDPLQSAGSPFLYYNDEIGWG
jgi:hypothetical protein